MPAWDCSRVLAAIVDIYEDEQRSLTRAQQPWPVYGTVQWTDIGPDDAMRIADVFACVRLLARHRRVAAAGRVPAPAPTATASGSPDGSPTCSRPRRPGNVTANLIGTVVAHLNLHGNAYIGKFRDSDGIVTQLAPLHPAGMTVDTRGGRAAVPYVDQNGAQELGTADVLHLKALSASTACVGLSPIAQARQALGLAQNLGKHADTLRRERRPARRRPARPGMALGAGHRTRRTSGRTGSRVRRH